MSRTRHQLRRLSSASDPAVDFTAKRGKIDRFGQQRLGTTFQRFSPGIGVAIGGDHDDGTVRSRSLRIRQKLKSGHSGHVDVGQDQNQRRAGGVADTLERAVSRLGKIHREAAGAEVAPKLLTKKVLRIGFVVNDKNKEARLSGPGLLGAAIRGRMTLNSVNSPGRVSTSIDPACCLTIISWLSERPRPVPSPGGLVVKNGLNIFSFTSGGMPLPLSRILISTRAPRALVAVARTRS